MQQEDSTQVQTQPRLLYKLMSLYHVSHPVPDQILEQTKGQVLSIKKPKLNKTYNIYLGWQMKYCEAVFLFTKLRLKKIAYLYLWLLGFKCVMPRGLSFYLQK